ncbi:MAG: serine hydrolase [Flavihumibacter sp.]
MPSTAFRTARRILLLLLLGLFLLVIRYAWAAVPVITGYSAKMACSCHFLAGRSIESISAEELGSGPLHLASVTANDADSSVTATVLGLARRKAIYRRGLGCTLVTGITETDIRKQPLPVFKPLPPDSGWWPNGDRLPDTIPAVLDKQKLDAAISKAFIDRDPEKPVRTRAVLVVYDQQLVGEKYGDGYSASMPLLSWSMAKSITSALVGILVKDGRLDISAPAPVAAWRSVTDGREHISLKNLLQQSSGLDFEEKYTKPTDATNMLYREADMAGFTAAHSLREAPGTRFYYSSGNSNIISGIIRQTVGDSSYYSFPQERLFHPIGIRSMVLEPDAGGTFVGSSYAFATARDWARFGLLYLNNGYWNGKQLLPEGWVKETVTPNPVAPMGEYGYQFWLNAGRRFPELPADMFYADGYEGQFVVVIPSRKLVLVRLGQTGNDQFDFPAFVKNILDALPPL